jgi:hypothetical protein
VRRHDTVEVPEPVVVNMCSVPRGRRTWATGGAGYHAADVVYLLSKYERLGFETEAGFSSIVSCPGS